MTWARSLVLALAVVAFVAPEAQARVVAETDQWSPPQRFAPTERILETTFASVAPGSSVVAYRTLYTETETSQLRVAVNPGDGFHPAQLLEPRGVSSFSLDASPAGGAVVSWRTENGTRIGIATLAPGSDHFSAPTELVSREETGWIGEPHVSVGENGDAAVAYGTPDGARVVLRNGGGGFDAATTSRVGSDQAIVSDLEIGRNGSIALGFLDRWKATLAVRDGQGTWGQPRPLGAEGEYALPQVGIDGRGNSVAVVSSSNAEDRFAYPLQVSFLSAAGVLSAGWPTGLNAYYADSFDLEVSALGEFILMSETAVKASWGGAEPTGEWVLFGNSVNPAIGAPERLSEGGRAASLAMNPRGDALITWQESACCSVYAQRRAPGESFGRVSVVLGAKQSAPRTLPWPQAAMDSNGNGLALWEDALPFPKEYFTSSITPSVLAPPGDPNLAPGLPSRVFAFPADTYPPPRIDYVDDDSAPELTFWMVPRVSEIGLLFKAVCSEQCWVSLRVKIKGIKKPTYATAMVPKGTRREKIFFVAPGRAGKLVAAAEKRARFAVKGYVWDEGVNSRPFHARSQLVPPQEFDPPSAEPVSRVAQR